MSEQENRWLPLFPLQLVPLPGEEIPLHIFEPRYQAMIRRCEPVGEPFGIMLAVEDRLAAVGCEVRVEKIVRRYPDGKLDLFGRCADRFRLLEIRQHQDGYIEGRVESLADSREPRDNDARETLLSLYAEFRRLLREGEQEDRYPGGREESAEGSAPEDAPGPDPEDTETRLTFEIAIEARMDLQERQQFLEMTSERRREQVLMRHLARLLPLLRGANANRRLVRGNGRLKSVGGTASGG